MKKRKTLIVINVPLRLNCEFTFLLVESFSRFSSSIFSYSKSKLRDIKSYLLRKTFYTNSNSIEPKYVYRIQYSNLNLTEYKNIFIHVRLSAQIQIQSSPNINIKYNTQIWILLNTSSLFTFYTNLNPIEFKNQDLCLLMKAQGKAHLAPLSPLRVWVKLSSAISVSFYYVWKKKKLY